MADIGQLKHTNLKPLYLNPQSGEQPIDDVKAAAQQCQQPNHDYICSFSANEPKIASSIDYIFLFCKWENRNIAWMSVKLSICIEYFSK